MLEKIKNIDVITEVRDWYGKYERPVSSLSLLAGFVFDALLLKRVDALWENIWVLGHIVIVATFMILVHTVESNPGDEADPHKLHFWLVNILQFVFGGLLSVFLVFYFRSSDLSVSWPFILILALAFLANERLKRQYVRMTFQVSLFFLSVFLCSIFLVPVIVHQIGTSIFVVSGVISLLIMYAFLATLAHFSRAKFEQSKRQIWKYIAGIFVMMNIFYFTNIIPPIPLSLKDYGVYHSIVQTADGNYTGSYEDVGWHAYVEFHQDVHLIPGSVVYAYTAIFAPTDLNTTIVHQWQYYDVTAKKWVTDSTVKLPLHGGREAGFRTYSALSGLAPGAWRVNVLTSSGQVIGRLFFNILNSTSTPPLSTKTL